VGHQINLGKARLCFIPLTTEDRVPIAGYSGGYLAFDVGHLSVGRVKRAINILHHEFPDLAVELTADTLRVFTPNLTRTGVSVVRTRILSELGELREPTGQSELSALSSGEGN
jgi:hypothetical protein